MNTLYWEVRSTGPDPAEAIYGRPSGRYLYVSRAEAERVMADCRREAAELEALGHPLPYLRFELVEYPSLPVGEFEVVG